MLVLPLMWMTRDRFAEIVVEALDALPETVRRWLDNVEVVLEDWPTSEQLAEVGASSGMTLLGLYEGVPRTARSAHYGMVLPDKVTVFRGPMLAHCNSECAVRAQVRRTVVHELAHHFGVDDERLDELGAY